MSVLEKQGDPNADVNGRVDISNKWITIEYQDTFPQNCIITLNAKGGRFITTGTKIKNFDLIYVEFIDRFGKKINDVFTVKIRKKIRKGKQGLLLQLICSHESVNLLTQDIYKPNVRSSGKAALIDAINQLNSNLGTNDPQIIITDPFDITKKLGIRLSDATSNNYIFERIKFGDAVKQILEKEGSPIEAGGSFQFFFFRFKSLYDYTTHTNLKKVGIQCFEQGFVNNSGIFSNTPITTLTKKLITEAGIVMSLDSTHETEQGTNLIAIGNRSSGRYPTDFAIFSGQKDFFNAALEWNGNGISYKKNQRVKYKGIFYKATIDHVSNILIPPTDPLQISWVSDNVFVPTVDYSPLTKLKAQYWINAMGGSKYADTATEKTAVVDPSVIIQDANHPRTWVDMIANDPIKVILKTDLMRNGLPFDGLRVLVADPITGSSTGTGAFSGNDPNGKAFSGSVIEYRDPAGNSSGQWFVFKSIQTNLEIYDFEEGDSWVYNPDGSNVWKKGAYVPIGDQFLSTFQANASFECVHHLKHNPGSRIDAGNEGITPDDTTNNSAFFVKFNPDAVINIDRFFAGVNFALPWPRQNTSSISFGNVKIGEKIALEVLDLLNMHRDHTGKRTSFGKNIEDLFPINGIGFFEKFSLTISGINPLGANFDMAIWFADRNDNKIEITYKHDRNGIAEAKSLSISKATVKVNVPGIASIIPAQAPEALNIFDPRSVIRGGIYTRGSFDQQGRYGNNIFSNVFGNLLTLGELKYSIDGFSFIKPLVSTNIIDSSKPLRNISPILLRQENIISKFQLDNLVKSSELIFNFKTERYNIKTAGRNDIQYGDPVYYTDTEAIDETTDTKTNTIKAVANNIIYSMSKTTGNEGGFIRTVELVTRIWP